MGEIYLAEDLRLRRSVVLKFLPLHLSRDADFKARFEHEAMAAAHLNHPGIVTIYELAEHDGRLLIAMEFVEGPTLQELLLRGPLKLKRALQLTLSIAFALDKAHEAGIVHRDIKPANILIDTGGCPKILDFGLAQSVLWPQAREDHLELGTLPYESPEQLLGNSVDARSDLFSLGIVLHEMLTGKRPFDGDYPESIQYAMLHEAPTPLAQDVPDCPESVQHLLNSLLAKSPEDRYGGAKELVADLKKLMASLKESKDNDLEPPKISPAYDYYLQGKQHYRQGRGKNLLFAKELYQKAIESDSDFALAHAALSICCGMLVHLYGDAEQVYLQLATAAANRAHELDSDLALGHAARGFVHWLQGDNDLSFASFETALKLDPDLFEAYYLYARECMQLGDMAKAAMLLEGACKVREDHEACLFLAQTYSALSREQEAIEAYARTTDILERYLQLSPGDARATTMGAVSWRRLGNKAKGLEWAERALTIDPDDAGIRYNVACLYSLEGEVDKALDSLESAVAAGFAHFGWVENDPDLDAIRNHPRFKALPWRGTTTSKQAQDS
jgi:tetratricopeptide (TPR) repeat protein